MVVRGWVFSSWIYPSSVTNYLQCWTLAIFFLGNQGPIYEMRKLCQETVIQTLKKRVFGISHGIFDLVLSIPLH